MKTREENSNYNQLAEEVQDSESKVKIVKVETNEARSLGKDVSLRPSFVIDAAPDGRAGQLSTRGSGLSSTGLWVTQVSITGKYNCFERTTSKKSGRTCFNH